MFTSGVKRKLGKGKKSLNKKGRDPKLILTFNEEENNLLRIIGHQGIGLESRYGDGTKVMSDQGMLNVY